jgi:hypothetical protein
MHQDRHRNLLPPRKRQGATMTASDFRFGFRILGATCETRRLVEAGAAFAAYAECDQRAECDREAYLSAFRFGEDFRRLLLETGSTAGYSGLCWSPWLWFDLDNEELHFAHKDAGALAAFLIERYGLEPADLLLFFSGSKGFHVGLPTSLWLPAPSLDFAKTARRFAEHVAELAAVTIDTGVYDRVRAFRAPNSRHPKTGLHKRRLTFDELLGPLDAILELGKTPTPFAVPAVVKTSDQAAADWQRAADQAKQESEAKAARRAAGNGTPTLNRSTLDFIRGDVEPGGHGTAEDRARGAGRHRLLFSAAANLGEFGCPPALAVALLEEPALDSGLPPKDVRRGIECGLAAVGAKPTHQDAGESTQEGLNGSNLENPLGAATSDSTGSEGQSCQQLTRATDSTPPDLTAALARLWAQSPAPSPNGTPENTTADAPPTRPPTTDQAKGPAVLPPDPPALPPLPAGAVGSGTLDTPCRCGSTQYVEMPIPEGRTRRDCRKCGRFAGWGRWYDGGPTQ